MTEKAEKILRKNRRRIQPIPGVNETDPGEFNQSTLDDVGPVAGGDQELKILKEMNELQEFENENWNRGAL